MLCKPIIVSGTLPPNRMRSFDAWMMCLAFVFPNKTDENNGAISSTSHRANVVQVKFSPLSAKCLRKRSIALYTMGSCTRACNLAASKTWNRLSSVGAVGLANECHLAIKIFLCSLFSSFVPFNRGQGFAFVLRIAFFGLSDDFWAQEFVAAGRFLSLHDSDSSDENAKEEKGLMSTSWSTSLRSSPAFGHEEEISSLCEDSLVFELED
mmetsp:Transcript_30062/g.71545  ORF Transcript_30062/g.71545 Transcript_30062/m.71545 type:complete len:209 (+) Transcript_30062:98-724(+)